MTYLQLRTQITDWLKRKDLSTQIPSFVSLGEKLLVDGLSNERMKARPLRVQEMEATKVYSPGDADTDGDPISIITLPNNYIEANYLMYGLQDTERAAAQTVIQGREHQGKPAYFYRELNTMVFSPMPEESNNVTLNYYHDPISGTLVNDGDTNIILTSYPNLYLYAALVSAEPFLFNEKRLPLWTTLLMNGIRSANDRHIKEKTSGGRKVMGRIF